MSQRKPEFTSEQMRTRRARRGKPAPAIPADVFAPIVRVVKAKEGQKPNRKQRRAPLVQIRRGMQNVGSRLFRRVKHRRELESADWMKQLRRSQRKQQAPDTALTPEQSVRLAVTNNETLGAFAERYAKLATPEQLEDERVKRAKDVRSSKRR